MKSAIAEAIELETQPVALVWADEAPKGASQFKPERWGCVVSLFAIAATKRRAGAFDRQTFGCWGGGVGLGFGNQYESFPGGMDCFCRFLADGNEQSEQGRAIGEQLQSSGGARLAEDFLHGERYVKDPESTRRFAEASSGKTNGFLDCIDAIGLGCGMYSTTLNASPSVSQNAGSFRGFSPVAVTSKKLARPRDEAKRKRVYNLRKRGLTIQRIADRMAMSKAGIYYLLQHSGKRGAEWNKNSSGSSCL
jgi:hypothetical protein